VQFPEAWIRTILRRELGKRRQRGDCTTLEGDVEAAAAAAPGLHDLLVNPWALVERHEPLLLGRLTNHERLVYHAVRQGWSLKRCAQELSMSERDVRTRFGRICKKLDGFLAYLVPPPPSV
jgi:DNA-binding NarL/FixJ family response regulator